MATPRDEDWQNAWVRAGLTHAHRRRGASKFYAIVAYPGASGFLHVGHLRGMTFADALHRYHRMLGDVVFFPTGTHASGLPAVTFAQKVRDRDPTTVAQLEANAVPPSEWPSLEDPENAARFLGRSYLEVYRRFGILVDEDAYLTTIDDDYQAFIRWQFRRLAALGALGQAPHFASVCPVCGPVSVDPSETDLSTGGDAEWLTYSTVPFRLEDGRILLAATLRPETVFGVTNLWIGPDHPLVVWHLRETKFLVGEYAAHRLVEQHGGKVGHSVDPRELALREVEVPLGGGRVPVLLSRLVDPRRGTGVVMSVPAHAPADLLALAELDPVLRSRVGPPNEIIVVDDPGGLSASEKPLTLGEGPPAARAARMTGARSLDDDVALEEATERLYRFEFVRGRMRPDLLDGLPVTEARAAVEKRLQETADSPLLQEFSKPVLCRNGHEVVIRRIPDQWFIRYSDPTWKSETEQQLRRMTIYPPSYGEELVGILDWFQDRPCTRRGRWLGTPFPQDPSWLIEPIADSTFYPAYYPVRPFVANGTVPVAALTDAFFDYVFLGEGTGEPALDSEVQRAVREEFRFWYPLDYNIGGKEHKRVHFPVFLYTHVRLLPPSLRPSGIAVHWWVTGKGGVKISKKEAGKKGGRIPPVRDALERWGADALRLFHAQTASPDQDIEWDEGQPDAIADRLAELERLADQLRVPGSGGPPELDRWLEAEFRAIVKAVRDDFSRFEFRDAAERIYARVPGLFRRYLHRGGTPGPVLERLLDAWVCLLSPLTPHLAERLGAGRHPDLVALRRFPAPEEFTDSTEALEAERFLTRVEDDVQNVLRPAEARGSEAHAVLFFVAAPWKRTVEEWLRTAEAGRGAPIDLRAVMQRAREHPELSAHLEEIPRYVQRVGPAVRAEGGQAPPQLDEVGLLRSAEGFLVRRFGFEEVSVFPEEEAEPFDPVHRRERARPGRPAFYLLNRSGDVPPRPPRVPK